MKTEHQYAYEAHVLRCHACAERERTAIARSKEERDDAGIVYAVQLKE